MAVHLNTLSITYINSTMSKREAISKSLRFEVFKRDKFTCKYCGPKAPGAVLHVDHIKPVKDGGTSDPLNLVTACQECNAGKGSKSLSDMARIEAARHQAELMQEAAEQLEMMAQWQADLNKVGDKLGALVNQVMKSGLGVEVSGPHLRTLTKQVKKHGIEKFNDCIDKTALWATGRNHTSVDSAVAKIVRLMEQRDPASDPKSGAAYITGILRNRMRLPWADLESYRIKVGRYLEAGHDFQDMKRIACTCPSIEEFFAALEATHEQPCNA